MNVWLIVLGGVCIGLVVVDALWTTVVPHGAGPVSSLLSTGISSAIGRLPRRVEHSLLPIMGSLCLLCIIASWIALLWLGWWLVFSAQAGSIVHSSTGAVASATDRLYFTGYTLFTLGIGDFVPRGGGWQFAATLASLSGLFFITLSITYLLPVLSAVMDKRQLAAVIHDLGATPTGIVANNWDGAGFDDLMLQLSLSIGPELHLHAERHLAYPVLHYFHSRERNTSLPLNLAALDEALMLLRCAVAPEARPRSAKLDAVEAPISHLLAMLGGRVLDRPGNDPALPSLDDLRQAAVPLQKEPRLVEAAAGRRERRRRLLAFVREAGWSWDDVLRLARKN